ncbi:MAG: glutamine amidotransferase, partial [Gammaproteobacteria bacterium]|nr:glutamine amidotransferase [Gammaproteobacteria bacterium]
MRTNLIIKAGEKLPTLNSVSGDYEDWMADILEWKRDDYRVVAVYLGEELPPHSDVKSVIITGTGAMVGDSDPWIKDCADWLVQASKLSLPVLGICFGHQLLAHALGGTVANNPRGVEVGSVTIYLTEEASKDSLFKELPISFSANVSHMQSVTKLPDGAKLLAYSDMERVHAFRYGECQWGIQFHPEFDGEIVKHFIHYFDGQLKREGRNMAALLARTSDTVESRALLKNFPTMAQKYP